MAEPGPGRWRVSGSARPQGRVLPARLDAPLDQDAELASFTVTTISHMRV